MVVLVSPIAGAILKLQEQGTIENLENKYFMTNSPCLTGSVSDIRAASFSSIAWSAGHLFSGHPVHYTFLTALTLQTDASTDRITFKSVYGLWIILCAGLAVGIILILRRYKMPKWRAAELKEQNFNGGHANGASKPHLEHARSELEDPESLFLDIVVEDEGARPTNT